MAPRTPPPTPSTTTSQRRRSRRADEADTAQLSLFGGTSDTGDRDAEPVAQPPAQATKIAPAAPGAALPVPAVAAPAGDSSLPVSDTGVAALAEAMRAGVLRWSSSRGGDGASAQAAADAAASLVAAQHEGHVCVRIDAGATRRALLASKVVAAADHAGMCDADLPFVLDAAGRFYLQRVFDHERAMARRIAAINRTTMPPVTPDVQARLRALFAAAPVQAEPDRQALAAALALLAPVLVVSGGPGTGKTTTLARILDLVSRQDPGTRIALAAPTGKAAARVTQALAAARLANAPDARAPDAPPVTPVATPMAAPRARTVHAWLGVHPRTGVPRHHARNPLPVDLLVVDEASMLDLELARRLFDALPAHARIVLLGDKDQLAAVQAGAVFAELASHPGAPSERIERAAALLGVEPGFLEASLNAPMTPSGASPPAATVVDDRADARTRPVVVHLVRGYRFEADSAIARLARSVRDGDADAAVALLKDRAHGDELAWIAPGREATPGLAQGLGRYLDALDSLEAPGHGAGDAVIAACLAALDAWRPLCAVHDGPSGTRAWNQRASAWVRARIDAQAHASSHAGASGGASARHPRHAPSADPWFTGRAVMVTRNDATLGLVNGDVGIVLPLRPRSLRSPLPEQADCDPGRPGAGSAATPARRNGGVDEPGLRHAAFLRADGSIARWPVARLPAVETAFATSVHKAQGSEFDRVTLVLPAPWQRPCTRELVYTALTRARCHVTLIADEATLRTSIATRTERLGGLGDRLREARLALDAP